MPVVVGNPCSAGTVLQALPTVQGMGSMDSADLDHGLAVGAQNLRLASLCAVNGGIGVGVVGDMRGGAVGGGDKIGYTVTLARGARGGLVDAVGITMVEHVGRFLPLMVVKLYTPCHVWGGL